jgi:sulfur carrier protein ThiS
VKGAAFHPFIDLFREDRMKIKINTLERELPPGTRFSAVVDLVRESQKNDPVTKSLMAKTGQDHITFMLNGRLIKPAEFSAIELKEGDSIRWMHPYAGG